MPDEDFCLNWSEHHSAFFKTAKVFCNSQVLTDVTLSCGPKDFTAHKLVLSVCSAYFSNLFTPNKFNPPPIGPVQSIVYLKDVNPRHMELLLEFMYNGQITCDEKELSGLLDTAKGLQIRGLTEQNEEEFGEQPAKKKKKLSRSKPFQPSLDYIKSKQAVKEEDQANQEEEEEEKDGEAERMKNIKEEMTDEGVIEAYGGCEDEDEFDLTYEDAIGLDETLLAPDQCPECMKRFCTKDVMKRHYRNVHVKEKPYECWECEYKATRRSTLGMHCLKIHDISKADFFEKTKDINSRIKMARKAAERSREENRMAKT